MRLGILNEFQGAEKYYIKACQELGVDYEVVDIISSDWIENIRSSSCDGFLVRPSYKKEVWKRMYDERLYFLNKVMGKPIYPSYDSLLIYENKKNMAYWLQLKQFPHPRTFIFYDRDEAVDFINNEAVFPLVFKTNIGSAALGVKYIEDAGKALRLIKRVFTSFKFFNRGYTKWFPSKFKIPYPLMDDKQYNYIIFQEKVDVKWEWRIIRIGESYFGHQKLSDGKYHSGSDKVGWVKPPEELLELTSSVCQQGDFRSMAVDIFEDREGRYYINELQALFGSYNPSQMYIDGVPGRYLKRAGEWIFEEGYFNHNGSCNLRVEDFMNILAERKAVDDRDSSQSRRHSLYI